MSAAVAFREIVQDDIDELATAVADAFLGYRVFAPSDWKPPPASEQASVLQSWIEDSDFWGELACEEGALAGHATFIPAVRHSFRPSSDASFAHLGHLFVKPEHWGSGVSGMLLARASSAAATRGFAAMRLFVPAGQARARRFYAREGFVAVGEPFEFGLGLPALEYQRSLAL
jgi:GNAT superfamily N-acetyltransferase